MLKNKLAGFVAKRALIYCIILSIIDIIWFKERWFMLGGLLVGGALSVGKFGSYSWVFGKILAPGTTAGGKAAAGTSISVFFLNQLILLPLLYLAYILNQWVFIGFVAGILLVPLVIMINCITEAIGITKNSFKI